MYCQAASYANGGEIFVLDMGEPVKIYEFSGKIDPFVRVEPNEDIKIKITGLRPGEKLYEELLMAEEGHDRDRTSENFCSKTIPV